MRPAAIFLLAGSLLYAGAPGRDAGASILRLPNAARSLLPAQATSLLPTTAGGRIAFAAGREIFLINADGSGLTQLTHSGPNVYNFQPALSPDGTRVAFARVEGTQGGIGLIDVDGSGLRNLTTNSRSYDNEPAWSPDGSRIAFVRGYDPTGEGVANFTQCGPAEIYVVSVDSEDGQMINLTPGGNSTDPAWSPDGTRIAFASKSVDNYDIYAITIEGGAVEQLTQTEDNEAEPAWSPDGKRIAYARGYVARLEDCGIMHTAGRGDSPGSLPDIYVMSDDGSNQNRWTETEDAVEPAWSPDGTSLAFVRIMGNATQIYVLDTDHKAAFSITSETTYKSSPSWSRADPRLLNDAK